ncbi:alpha/beta hydrolase [Arthrobacter rhombi]|uniref:alpha/beta fold hydrolase n=1 Tax=Arthrobacter rhombi TaxID=71253 RepID=UPI0031D94A3D
MPQTTGADGNTLNYEDTGGAGRPVVLIHGWPLHLGSWADQVKPLQAAGHRVITYDRRGFGASEPSARYDYDALAADLAALLDALDLHDATLVGFSMGGGEVVRYIAHHGEDRLRSVVLAAAVPPYLLKSDANPEGPLTETAAQDMQKQLEADREAFLGGFMRTFYSAGDKLLVTDAQLQATLAMTRAADRDATAACMESFATTDFRDDLEKVTVPTLIVHGDSDAIVPVEGSGRRTHRAIPHSELCVIRGGPHGLNVSHPDEFNAALVDFLGR